jgi:hypothetical protein
MKKVTYVLVFLVGFGIGFVLGFVAWQYAKSVMYPRVQQMGGLFYVQGLEAETNELDRLRRDGAPVAAVEFQYDRIRRMMEFLRNQTSYYQFIDNDNKDDTFESDMMILEGRWSRYLHGVGRDEDAAKHMALGIQYGVKSHYKITDLKKADEFFDLWESTVAKSPSKSTQSPSNAKCNTKLELKDMIADPWAYLDCTTSSLVSESSQSPSKSQ